jgi:hypothetical protein
MISCQVRSGSDNACTDPAAASRGTLSYLQCAVPAPQQLTWSDCGAKAPLAPAGRNLYTRHLLLDATATVASSGRLIELIRPGAYVRSRGGRTRARARRQIRPDTRTHGSPPPPLRSVVIWQRLLHACARPRQPAPDRPTGGEAGPTTPRALSLQLHIMNGCCGRRRRTKRATTPSYYRTGQQPRGARQAGKRSRGIASGRARCGCGLICWRHGGCGRWTTARGQRAGWPG